GRLLLRGLTLVPETDPDARWTRLPRRVALGQDLHLDLVFARAELLEGLVDCIFHGGPGRFDAACVRQSSVRVHLRLLRFLRDRFERPPGCFGTCLSSGSAWTSST